MSRQTLDDLHGEVAVAQITITMTRNGNCKVEGAITDHDFAKFMLDTARDVVNNFHQRKQIMEGKGVIVPVYDTPLVNTPQEQRLLAARHQIADAM
jgi:hypothetical protein